MSQAGRVVSGNGRHFKGELHFQLEVSRRVPQRTAISGTAAGLQSGYGGRGGHLERTVEVGRRSIDLLGRQLVHLVCSRLPIHQQLHCESGGSDQQGLPSPLLCPLPSRQL